MPRHPPPGRLRYVFGISIVAIIPVVVLFMIIEKRLVGGLTAGSVK